MPGECRSAEDCLEREWPIDCTGHWECQAGRCAPVGDCGQERGCGDAVCDSAGGESRASCGIDCQCDAPIDCLGGDWPVRCMGRWVCEAHRCEASVCGPEGGCGDGICEPEMGEGPRSCGADCDRPLRPACASDAECPVNQWCNPCGAASCPGCADCVAACAPHECETEREAQCNEPRPQCDEGFVAVVREGCWSCVDRATCEEREPPPMDCVPDGGRRAVHPDALPCCPGLVSIGCDRPSAETGGMCRRGCVGASYCTACGDGACGDGENDCNCPQDCG